MPTAGKLVAALLFGALAFVSAELYKPGMPEGTYFGPFSLICAAIGAACGWRVMARRTGQGASRAISAGLQAALTFLFFALLGFAIYQMVRRSMRGMYGSDPIEAVAAVFELMLEYGALVLNPPVLGTLLIGGMAAGLATEWAAKRWS